MSDLNLIVAQLNFNRQISVIISHSPFVVKFPYRVFIRRDFKVIREHDYKTFPSFTKLFSLIEKEIEA